MTPAHDALRRRAFQLAAQGRHSTLDSLKRSLEIEAFAESEIAAVLSERDIRRALKAACRMGQIQRRQALASPPDQEEARI